MKKISFWFLISFISFFIGEICWSTNMFMRYYHFGTLDGYELLSNLMFLLCSIFGLIGSYQWYKKEK